MRSVIEHLNKSPQGKQRFNELQDELMNTSLAVISHAAHRFLSLTKVIKRCLELSDSKDKYYDKKAKALQPDVVSEGGVEATLFPHCPGGSADARNSRLQQAQRCPRSTWSCWSPAEHYVSHSSFARRIRCRTPYAGGDCAEDQEADEEGLQKRFFVRYNPELKTLGATTGKAVEAVKKTVWDKIRAMAIRAATKLSAAGGAGFEAGYAQKDDLWRGWYSDRRRHIIISKQRAGAQEDFDLNINPL
ncbi:hypothetical protein Plhal304r1_c095g0173371 [Plasmopara halstedii]